MIFFSKAYWQDLWWRTKLYVRPSRFSSDDLKEIAFKNVDRALDIFLTPRYRQNLSLNHVIDIINFYEKQKPQTFLNTLRGVTSGASFWLVEGVDYSDTENLEPLKNLLVSAHILKRADIDALAAANPADAKRKLFHIILVMLSTLGARDFTPEQKVKFALLDPKLAEIILYNPRINRNLEEKHIIQILKGYLIPSASNAVGIAVPNREQKQQLLAFIQQKVRRGDDSFYRLALENEDLADVLIENNCILNLQHVVKIAATMPPEFLNKHWGKIKAALLDRNPDYVAARKDFFEALQVLNQDCQEFVAEYLRSDDQINALEIVNLKQIRESLQSLSPQYIKIRQFLLGTLTLIQYEEALQPYLPASLKIYLEDAENPNISEPDSETMSSSSDSEDKSPPPLLAVKLQPNLGVLSVRRCDARIVRDIEVTYSTTLTNKQLNQRNDKTYDDKDKREERYKEEAKKFEEARVKEEKEREAINAEKSKKLFEQIKSSLITAAGQGDAAFSAKLFEESIPPGNIYKLIEIVLSPDDYLSPDRRKQIAKSLFEFRKFDFNLYLHWFNSEQLEKLFIIYENDKDVLNQMFAYLSRCFSVPTLSGDLTAQFAKQNTQAALTVAKNNDAFANAWADSLFSIDENEKIVRPEGPSISVAIQLSQILGSGLLKKHLMRLILVALSNQAEFAAFIEAKNPSLLKLLHDAFSGHNADAIKSQLKDALESTLSSSITEFSATNGISAHQTLLNALSKIANERTHPRITSVVVSNISFNTSEAKSKAAAALQCTTLLLDKSLLVFPDENHQNAMTKTLEKNGVTKSDYILTPVLAPHHENAILETQSHKTLFLAPSPGKGIEQFGVLAEHIKWYIKGKEAHNFFQFVFRNAIEKIEEVAELIGLFNILGITNDKKKKPLATDQPSANRSLIGDMSHQSPSPAQLMVEMGMHRQSTPTSYEEPLDSSNNDKKDEKLPNAGVIVI